MEHIIEQILEMLRAGDAVDDRVLVKLIHAEARRAGGDKRAFAKRRLLPFYQHVKRDEPERWKGWGISPELEERLLKVLRMKPRRSASGVATITVITKPWPCSGSCLFCPSDIRMPKSYLADEPACARAEQACFDPYLQVSARLTALSQMGHATDKIELIVLGGTWSDYPRDYQVWFMTELFRALNDDAVAGVAANPLLRGFAEDAGHDSACDDGPSADASVPPGVARRREQLCRCGLMSAADEVLPRALVPSAARAAQHAIDEGRMSYNEAFRQVYGASDAWGDATAWQRATFEQLEREQRRNETARHRVVGLVIETRPDAISPQALALIRRMGATKIQMGVQSVDQETLDANGRGIQVAQIERAFSLLRLFGFKIHAHFMVNLLGATPEGDVLDYQRFATADAFQPDEVKLYPCALIASSRLSERYEDGSWRPYGEDELVDVLTRDVLATPAFTRVSRMIRDFSSKDIVAGNKKPNLRQMVEDRLRASNERVQEIRFREIATSEVSPGELRLQVVPYETSTTSERFLQWVTLEGRIAGFLRLSLPHDDAVRALVEELASAAGQVGRRDGGAGEDAGEDEGISAARSKPTPVVAPGEAMIREVHVYGMAARVGEEGSAAQHHGLGRNLVERACEMAREAGFARINVISAVGTREYYRHLGFYDHGLYQQRRL